MKRAYLATLTITLLTATSVYAINCKTIPTCAELGYTDTVSSCSGDSIKCPFDTTKGKCLSAGATVGQIAYFPKEITDPKWIKCDGRILHKDAYPELYEVLKYSFGGTGGNIFRVPDYSGDFIRVYGGDANPTSSRQAECLPNITGTWVSSVENQSYSTPTGAFYEGPKTGDGVDGNEGWFITMKFDASRSNSIYSSSCSHVTPVNTAVYAYIYAGKVDTSKGSAKDLIAGCATNSYYYTDGTCSTSLKSSISLKGIVNAASSDRVYYFNGGGNSVSSYLDAVNRCRSMNANGGVLSPSTAASYIGNKITSITGSVHPVSTSRTYWSSATWAYSCSSATSCSTSVSPKAGTSYYFFCHGTDYFQ